MPTIPEPDQDEDALDGTSPTADGLAYVPEVDDKAKVLPPVTAGSNRDGDGPPVDALPLPDGPGGGPSVEAAGVLPPTPTMLSEDKNVLPVGALPMPDEPSDVPGMVSQVGTLLA